MSVFGDEEYYESGQARLFKWENRFRLPSEISTRSRKGLSIPSKREGTGKAITTQMEKMQVATSFNSLQTGTHRERTHQQAGQCVGLRKFQFPSNGNAQGKSAQKTDYFTQTRLRFNSLQTGTHRERHRQNRKTNCPILFQFPSNGKAQGKVALVFGIFSVVSVSIPFKREGTGKERRTYVHL